MCWNGGCDPTEEVQTGRGKGGREERGREGQRVGERERGGGGGGGGELGDKWRGKDERHSHVD